MVISITDTIPTEIDYNSLYNLPSINNVVLKGNRNIVENPITTAQIDIITGNTPEEGEEG